MKLILKYVDAFVTLKFLQLFLPSIPYTKNETHSLSFRSFEAHFYFYRFIAFCLLLSFTSFYLN
jgi:hypothetical protein